MPLWAGVRPACFPCFAYVKMLTLICIRSILPVIIPVPRRRPRRPPSHYPYLPSTRRAWCDACVTCLHWPQDRSPCAGHAQQLVLQAVDRKIFLVLEQLQEYIDASFRSRPSQPHVLPRPHAPPPLILGRELGSLQHTHSFFRAAMSWLSVALPPSTAVHRQGR